MPPEALKYLSDILQAICEIESFFPDGYRFQDYQKNLMQRKAVERELEIIGEAMNRLMKLNSGPDIPEAQRVIALRNRVIHGYDRVDDVLVWSVVVNHIPTLKIKVESFLS